MRELIEENRRKSRILMGLMLAVGMLVDASIVVIESIYRHYQDLGEDARTAALRGTT